MKIKGLCRRVFKLCGPLWSKTSLAPNIGVLIITYRAPLKGSLEIRVYEGSIVGFYNAGALIIILFWGLLIIIIVYWAPKPYSNS